MPQINWTNASYFDEMILRAESDLGVPYTWHGGVARAWGIEGDSVKLPLMRQIADGYKPDGTPYTTWAGKPERALGVFNATTICDKATALWVLSKGEDFTKGYLKDAIKDYVHVIDNYIEPLTAVARVTKDRVTTYVPSEGLYMVGPDPIARDKSVHFHIHRATFNVVLLPNGEHKTWTNELDFALQKPFETAYHAIRQSKHESKYHHAYEWEKGLPRLQGIPKELVAMESKRTEEISTEAKKIGYDTPGGRRIVHNRTKGEKYYISIKRLCRRVLRNLRALEIKELAPKVLDATRRLVDRHEAAKYIIAATTAEITQRGWINEKTLAMALGTDGAKTRWTFPKKMFGEALAAFFRNPPPNLVALSDGAWTTKEEIEVYRRTIKILSDMKERVYAPDYSLRPPALAKDVIDRSQAVFLANKPESPNGEPTRSVYDSVKDAREVYEKKGYRVISISATIEAAQEFEKRTSTKSVTPEEFQRLATERRGFSRGMQETTLRKLGAFSIKRYVAELQKNANSPELALDHKTIVVLNDPKTMPATQVNGVLEHLKKADVKVVLVEPEPGERRTYNVPLIRELQKQAEEAEKTQLKPKIRM